MSDDGFNIRAMIRTACAAADSLNVDKIVWEVQRSIPAENRDDVLRIGLACLVQDAWRSMRQHTTIRAVRNDDNDGNPTPGRSAKVRAIRAHGDYWRRALEQPYSVDRNGNAFPLGDLTRDHLLFNILAREEQARRANAKALQLRGLMDLMVRHDARKVRDLPESVLAETLVSAA